MKKPLFSSLFLLYTSLSFFQLFEGFENTTGKRGHFRQSGNWAVFESISGNHLKQIKKLIIQ